MYFWVYIHDNRRFLIEASSPEEAEEIYISGGKIIEDIEFGYASLRAEKIPEDEVAEDPVRALLLR